MPDPDGTDRHSKADEASIITDPDEVAQAEARNALRQFDLVLKLIDDFVLTPERPFRLRPSTILQIHHKALEGLSAYAGNFRPAKIEISGSLHQPPEAHLVPEKIEDLCDFVNTHWDAQTPVFLSSYVMWRLNWIHPFSDGNGRTSRALSYLVLCVKLGYRLPGTKTIPEQIARNKGPYYSALEAADRSDRDGKLNLSCLEELISQYLAAQLLDVYQDASERERQNHLHKFH